MFPNLIENKIDWYQWRSAMMKVCLEYHQTYRLGRCGHYNRTHQRQQRSNQLFTKKLNANKKLSPINWRWLDQNWSNTQIFTLKGEFTYHTIPKNY